MDMTLRFRDRSRSIPLPHSDSGWKSHGKRSEQHCFQSVPDAAPPFGGLFLKRYHRRRAPAHDLLTRLLTKRQGGSAMPLFLGYAHTGEWHTYAFSHLLNCHLLSLVTGSRRAPHGQTLSPELFAEVLDASSRAFSFLQRHGYYYADYAFENMLVHRLRGNVILIDVDSAFPLSAEASSSDCRQTWWTLFMSEGISHLGYLNATMLMSMALVSTRALNALRHRGAGANVSDILRAHPDDQRALFTLLSGKKRSAFARNFFLPRSFKPKRLDALFTEWNGLLSAMKRGEPISRADVLRTCSHLLALADADGSTRALTGPDPLDATPITCGPKRLTPVPAPAPSSASRIASPSRRSSVSSPSPSSRAYRWKRALRRAFLFVFFLSAIVSAAIFGIPFFWKGA